MSYSKCPICNGSGIDPQFTQIKDIPCQVCKGARLIDDSSGKPPEHLITDEGKREFDIEVLKKVESRLQAQYNQIFSDYLDATSY